MKTSTNKFNLLRFLALLLINNKIIRKTNLVKILCAIAILLTSSNVLGQVGGVDGDYCPLPGDPGDEYAEGLTFIPTDPGGGTCAIEQIWADIDIVDGSFKLGFKIGNSGTALFRIYIDSDNNSSTGLLIENNFGGTPFAVGGAEFILEIRSNNGNTKLYEADTSSTYSQVPLVGLDGANGNSDQCGGNGDGQFLEFYVPFEEIGYDPCDQENPGEINIAQYASVSGGDPNSSFCLGSTLNFGVELSGSVAADQTICPGGNVDTLILTLEDPTNSSVEYWEVSSDGTMGSYVLIPGTANQETYTPSGLSAGTYYYRARILNMGICENSFSSSSAIITVITDNEDPVFVETLPGNVTLECGDTIPTAPTLTATDNCGSATVEFNESTNLGCGNTEVITRTWTATDGTNSAIHIQIITVEDTTDPIITCPTNITVTADPGQPNANVTIGLPTVSDTCGNVTYSNDYTGVEDASGIYALGTTTVTYTVTDDCGNTSQCSFTVTVNDDEAPVFNCASTITVSCIADVPAAYANYNEFVAAGGSATDNNGINEASFTLFSETSDNNTCPETIIRVYTISDNDGNTSECGQTITVNDEIDPVLVVPADETVECDAVPAVGTPTATDNCDADVDISYDGESRTDGTCPNYYTLTRTWTATDNCDNTHTLSQIITVEDTTDPTIDTDAADSTVECDGAGNSAQLTAWLTSNGGAAASDTCGGVTWSNDYSALSNDCGNTGSALVTFTATDDCGNSSTTSATFTIQDTTVPSIDTTASDLTVECDGSGNTSDLNTWLSNNGGAAASDACAGVTWSNDFTTLSDDCGNTGSATVIFTATDECGLTSTTSATFTIQDTTNPMFNESLPANDTVDADSIPDAETLTASDNCGNATVEFNEVMNGSFCDASYTLVRAWTATDECNQTTIHTQTITVNLPVIEVTIENIVDVLCNSESTGAIDISVTGGTAPYTFVWNNGATTEDLSGILAGAYNVTVTDANGCTTSINATVSEPANPLGLNISKIDATTAQGCTNGEATVSVTGGTPNYMYLWSASAGNQTTATATNLPDGTHSVTITDDNGCELTQSIVIECVNTCDAEISIDDIVNVLCTGDNSGSGTVSANSNANPSATFTFTWSNGQVDSGVTSSTLNNITAGVYTVSVTIDGTVCQPVEDTISITEPSNALNLTLTATDELGPGTGDGTATAVATGGVEPYTYVWTPGGETTDSITGLAAGDYCVTVTDANGCTDNICITVNPGSCLNLSISGSSTPVVCNGESNGSVTSTVSGGVGSFTYAWDSLPDTTASVSNLPAGDYTVTVTDATTQCTQSTTITINEPNLLSSGIAATNVLCKNESTGSLDLTVNGGTTPYTFLWSDGSTSEDLINVLDGTYSVTITDANGCTTTNQATVIEPDAVVSGSITSQTNVDCFGNATGEVTVEGAGGIPPYSYALDGGTSQTNGTFSGLAAGNYTITITDANGCTFDVAVTITEPNQALEASILSVTDVLCNSEATGEIDISVTGGTEPYTFVWNNGATTEDLSDVLAGAYNVTITDVNGCTTSISATISEPANPLSINISKIDANTAQGCTNGEAIVSVTGGTPDYTYLWSASAGNQTTATATNLPDGTHSVTVTDANGCELTQSIIIECVNTCDAEISIDSVVDVLCTGDNSGSGTVSANSNANPSATFTFTWSNGQVDSGVTSSTLNNITAGVYTVSVTIDGTVCQPVEDTISITEPSNALNLTLTATDELGPGTGDGTATAVATGGVEPYTYVWTPGGETTDSITGLAAGDYCVTVTDANGCTDNICITVNPGSCLNLSISGSSTPVVCNGESNGSVTSTVSGGVGSFTYAWDSLPDTTASVSNLPAGDYTVTVTDATTQCTQSTTITINEPNELSSGIAVTNILCKNESTGSLDLTVNGGTAPYTFVWSDGSTDEDLINVPDGTYSVTITDANGCTTTNQATIIEPDEVVSGSIVDQTNVDCLGNSTGEVTVEGAGGIPPYQYALDGGSSQTSGTFSGLAAGDYIITVIDANGCTFDIPVTITTDDVEGPEITVPSDITIEGCSTSDITAANSVFDFSDVTSGDVQSIFASNTDYNASDDFEIESITYIDVVISTDNCPIIVQRTFTITDTCGNSVTATQTITVQDTTAPTIDVDAADLTVECDGNGNTTELNDWLDAFANATASDTCSDVTWSNDFSGSLSDDCGATGSATVIFTATDECGNTSTSSATFTIEDTTAPTIDTEASNLTVECDGNGNIDQLNDWLNSQGGSATASDTCSDLTWSNDFSGSLSDECGANGSATVIFTATDECGNTSTSSATFTIEDTTAPTIDTEASNLTVECDGNGNIDQLNDWLNAQGGSATASDTCSDLTWSNDFSGSLSDDCGATGSATVTFTATDDCGNFSLTTATFTIVDTTAPTFTVPADLTIECDQDDQDLTLTGDVTDEADNCSTGLDATYVDAVAAGACANESVITRTWTLVDDCGNTTNTDQTITVVDTTAPTFTVPADLTIECDQDDQDLTLTGDVTDEADNCSTGLDATYVDAVAAGACANESVITRTWTLVDDCGNTTNTDQTITVVDTTAPTFTVPADLTIECDQDDQDLTLTGDVTDEADNCSTGLDATYVDAVAAGACANESVITRTWTLVDDCGNTTNTDQTITVVDTTAPTFTVPADLTIECDQDDQDLTLTGDVTDEADNCSTGLDATYVDAVAAGACANESVITRTWTLVDDCGNTTNTDQTITVVDTTAPTFTVPADLTIECDQDDQDLTLTGDVTDEADNCSTGLDATYVDAVAAGACANESVITRTWTLVDDCGNTTNTDQTITVVDTTAPTFTVPADLTIECDIDVNDVSLTGDVTDEADNCSTNLEATFSDSVADGECTNESVITRTWTLVDDCGNTITADQTITVVDTTAPELITNLPTTLSASCDDIPTAPNPGFADNCSTNLSVVFNESTTIIGTMVDDYEIVRTWTVTDECGNTSVFTQIVTVAVIETVTQITDSICFDDGTVDLNDYLNDIDQDVSWEVVSGGATLDGSILDPLNLDLADYVFTYTFAEVGGCLSTTELTITVDDSCIVLACEAEDVIISKAVTANGDQWNEYFTIGGVDGCGFIYDVQIFNRWGAKIFESNNYQNDWSGTAHKNSIGNADKVPTGTYYYIVKLRNSSDGLELKPFTGPIYVGTK